MNKLSLLSVGDLSPRLLEEVQLTQSALFHPVTKFLLKERKVRRGMRVIALTLEGEDGYAGVPGITAGADRKYIWFRISMRCSV